MSNVPTKGESQKNIDQIQAPIIFSNSPSGRLEDDLIGLDAHVNSIEQAINDGNKLIGILADFGTGKSTLIEQLRERYSKKDGFRIHKINLWAELTKRTKETKETQNRLGQPRPSEKNQDTTESGVVGLNKSFLYQFAASVNARCGEYVNQRLNVGYKLIKVTVSKPWTWWLLAAAAFIWVFALLIHHDVLWGMLKECDKGYRIVEALPIFLISAALTCIGVFTKFSELLISSPKYQSDRDLQPEDYAEIFQYILMEGNTDTQIIVFEDIDRIGREDDVSAFLIELNRYCVTNTTDCKVVFIVNMKPQELLYQKKSSSVDKKDLNNTYDFTKLFDYVLLLRPLNPMDMETLLDSFVLQNAEFYKAHGIIEDGKRVCAKNVPGFAYLSYGKSLDIRHLKYRLNNVNQLYYSLISRFLNKKKDIRIETCAAVAYLEDAYPKEFYELTPNSIGRIMANYTSIDGSTFADWKSSVQTEIKNASEAFTVDLATFLHNRVIDRSYRTYFYNYSKLGRVFSYDELTVYNLIVYDSEYSEKQQVSVEIVCANKSDVVKEALDYRTQLGKPLPHSVIQSEELFWKAYETNKEMVTAYIDEFINMEQASEALELLDALTDYKSWGQGNNLHQYICGVVERKAKIAVSSVFRTFRIALAQKLGNRIVFFECLYSPDYIPLTIEEAQSISDPLVLLRLVHAENIPVDILNYVHKQFISVYHLSNSNQRENLRIGVETLYEGILKLPARGISTAILNPILSDHMEQTKIWNEAFAWYLGSHHTKENFVHMVNEMPADSAPEVVFSSLRAKKVYSGLNGEWQNELLSRSYGVEFFCNARDNLLNVAKWPDEAFDLFVAEAAELYEVDAELFVKLRLKLCQQKANRLRNYKFLFNNDFAFITADELFLIKSSVVLDILAETQLTEENVDDVAKRLNHEHHNQTTSRRIVKYLYGIDDENAREALFKALDFSKIMLVNLSKSERERCLQAVSRAYPETSALSMISYMEHTKVIDEFIEQKVLNAIQRKGDHSKTFEAYDELLEYLNPQTPSEACIDIIKADRAYRLRPQAVLQKLYAIGDYQHYVMSNRPVHFEEDKKESLNDTYFELFTTDDFARDRQSFVLDSRSLDFIYDLNRFPEMTYDALCLFVGHTQSVALLSTVFTLEDNEVLEYFSNASKLVFADSAAVSYFLEMITNESRPRLILDSHLRHLAYDAFPKRFEDTADKHKMLEKAYRKAKKQNNMEVIFS